MSDDYQNPVRDVEFNCEEPAEHLPASVVFEYLTTSSYMEKQRNPGARLDLARTLGLLTDRSFNSSIHFIGKQDQFTTWRTATNAKLVADAKGEDAELIDIPNAQMFAGGPDTVAGRLLPFLYQTEGDVRGAVKAYETAREETDMTQAPSRRHRGAKPVGVV